MNSFFRIISFIFIFFIISDAKAQNISFIKTYNNDQWDFGFATQQTSDSGFMLFGETGHNNGSSSVQYLDLIKTDGYGNVLWSNTFGLNGLRNLGISAKQTFDNGFILCGSYGNLNSDTLALVKTDTLGNEVWHHTYSAHNIRDVGQSVLQTTDSGFIAIGFEGSTNPSVYIVKTDSAGNLQWSNSFPQTGYEIAQCIKQVGSNGYIACGRTNSKGNGQFDIYLMRIDAFGDSLWSKTYGTDSSEYGSAVDLTSDGGFIIVGEDYYPGGDIWLVKTDSSGIQQWSRKFGGTGWDFGNDVKQCGNGDFVIAGRKEENPNDNQFYCLRTDSLGILRWDYTFPMGLMSEARSVFQNSDGGFVFLGDELGATGDSSDFYYLRLDSNGVLSVSPSTNNSLNKLSVFPNPTSGITNIFFNCEGGIKSTILVTDLFGKIVYEKQEINSTNVLYEKIDLSNCSAGLYFLILSSNGQVFSKKIFKE